MGNSQLSPTITYMGLFQEIRKQIINNNNITRNLKWVHGNWTIEHGLCSLVLSEAKLSQENFKSEQNTVFVGVTDFYASNNNSSGDSVGSVTFKWSCKFHNGDKISFPSYGLFSSLRMVHLI